MPSSREQSGQQSIGDLIPTDGLLPEEVSALQDLIDTVAEHQEAFVRQYRDDPESAYTSGPAELPQIHPWSQ